MSTTTDVPIVRDCWNKIGVRGDKSCPALVTYIHCRNCPVYAMMAHELLDRPLAPGQLDEWADHFGREPSPADRDMQSALIFRIGVEWFALSTMRLNEVAEIKPVHSLPHRRNRIVLGLVNIRGELLICVSLAEALGLDKETEDSKNGHGGHPYLLVANHEGNRLVFPVDEVSGIHHFSWKTVKAVPATVAGAASRQTTGILSWQDKSVGCLDEQLLFRTLNASLS